MKRFKKFRDDRFALTTLQNPLCEASPAELFQAAEHERQRHAATRRNSRHTIISRPKPTSRPRRASRGKPLTRTRSTRRRPGPTQFPK